MIAIGSDHGGFDLKQKVMTHLKERGIEYKDCGCMDKSSCIRGGGCQSGGFRGV